MGCFHLLRVSMSTMPVAPCPQDPMSHTYVVDDFIWHVRSWGERAEVFFHTVVPSNWRAEKTRWLRIFATNFPEEPPVTAELFEERKAQVLGVPRATYAVKRVQGPPCGTPSAPPPAQPHPSPVVAEAALAAAAIDVRHQVGLSQKEMDALSRIIKEATGLRTRWQSDRVKAQEQTLPAFDRSPGNDKLLHDLVAFQISSAAATNPPNPFTSAEVSLFVWCDGYTPRGRSSKCIKVALLDRDAILLPCVPGYTCGVTHLMTWRDWGVADMKEWVGSGGFTREMGHLAGGFILPIMRDGQVVRCPIKVTPVSLYTADHLELWGVLQRPQKFRAVFCSHPVDEWLDHLGICTHITPQQVMGQPCLVLPPILHDMKGAGNRGLGIVGRALPGNLAVVFFKALRLSVKRKYAPPPSCDLAQFVRQRFSGDKIAYTGREVRYIFSYLLSHIALPLPHHHFVVCFSRLITLQYKPSEKLAPAIRAAVGFMCTFVCIFLLEMMEAGSTKTTYWHSIWHWHFAVVPQLPLILSDEAGERLLKVMKDFAKKTSTQAEQSSHQVLVHEMYQRVRKGHKRLRSYARCFTEVEYRSFVFEPCWARSNETWSARFFNVLGFLQALEPKDVVISVAQDLSFRVAFNGLGPVLDAMCVCTTCQTSQPRTKIWTPWDGTVPNPITYMGLVSNRKYRSHRRRAKQTTTAAREVPSSEVNDGYGTDVSVQPHRTLPLRQCRVTQYDHESEVGSGGSDSDGDDSDESGIGGASSDSSSISGSSSSSTSSCSTSSLSSSNSSNSGGTRRARTKGRGRGASRGRGAKRGRGQGSRSSNNK